MDVLTNPNATIDEILRASDPGLTTSAGDVGGGILAVIMAFLGIFLAVALLWYVLQVIAYWKIFTKAGQPGWKSIIPFYNTYVQYQLTWETTFFWIGLALAVVGAVVGNFAGLLANLLGLAAWLACIVINIIALNRLSRSFGHGAGFTVGLVLLEPVFMLILGFSKDAYIGNTSKEPAP